ncbi:MAG: class A beta-lactamase [Erythrobacter sp.]
MTIDRRAFVAGALALGAAACVPIDRSRTGRLAANLRIIEANAGGTLGVEFSDVDSGASIGHNRDARFGHCSSFKLSLAAMVLERHPQRDDFRRMVTVREEDVLGHSPFVREHVGEEVNLLELAEAAQRFSDNGATNILLREIGGPEAMTAFWRALGDDVSRLDRIEPQLNHVPDGEIRDTTTPRAMARTVAKLLYGDVLDTGDRALLRHWMIDTRTGMRRVRAGLPPDWQSGDKTGTSIWPGMGSLYVDIGFAEPPGRGPLTFAVYYRAPVTHVRTEATSEQVLAQVGELLTRFSRLG